MRTFRELALDRTRKPFMIGAELVTTRGALESKPTQKLVAEGTELAAWEELDWISITDNAGGNPQLAPSVLGTKLMSLGKDVIVHLTCKDRNRNGLESAAWQYESEGLRNILCLTGDYPIQGYCGPALPVFDLDSATLARMLAQLNAGLAVPGRKPGTAEVLPKTSFFIGAAVSPFKTNEAELICQYLKLELKLKNGAQFIIPQLGYEMRKSHELLIYLQKHAFDVPVFGNIYVLTKTVAGLFNRQQIPGCQVSAKLLAASEKAAAGEDKGKGFFLELAAKQYACFKGLGYRGAYFGGFAKAADVKKIVELGEAYGPNDWRSFARDVMWPMDEDCYIYAQDATTGLADGEHANDDLKNARVDRRQVTLMYQLNTTVHALAFDPKGVLHKPVRGLYRFLEKHPTLRKIADWKERVIKAALFSCQDCGDCSLVDCAYLCPMVRCRKNQRNGPCGGSRGPLCEVTDVPCIWYRAYHRAKRDGTLGPFLRRELILRNPDLAHSSSWANYFLGRDHAAALVDPAKVEAANAAFAAAVKEALAAPEKKPAKPKGEAKPPSAAAPDNVGADRRAATPDNVEADRRAATPDNVGADRRAATPAAPSPPPDQPAPK